MIGLMRHMGKRNSMANSIDFASMGFHFTFGVVAAIGAMYIWFLVLYLIFQLGRLIFWFVTDKSLKGLRWVIWRFKKHMKGKKKTTETEQVNNNLYPKWKKEEVEKMIEISGMKWKKATSKGDKDD